MLLGGGVGGRGGEERGGASPSPAGSLNPAPSLQTVLPSLSQYPLGFLSLLCSRQLQFSEQNTGLEAAPGPPTGASTGPATGPAWT